MSSIDFIKQLSAGNAAEAKETLSTMLSNVAIESLEDRKQEIAQGLFGGSAAVVEEEVESLDEAKRLISTHTSESGIHTAKVYRDPEYNEYQVHYFKNGKHMGEGPVGYHTDKEDAEGSAKYSLAHLDKQK